MTTTQSDAELVAGHLAGDPSALAGIYDRYADSLHDTAAAMLGNRHDSADVLQDVILIAAERLGQLRDPARLRPWLFAILRNEVYRRTRQRRRTVATDFSEPGTDMADDRQLDVAEGTTDSMAGDELASLVREAAGGLDERDQLVLELSVRQGLEGQDLADALGVTANQSYTLVHRMRERVERSLGAFVVARAGRKDCPDLDRLLASWDGEFTVLIRKRVARHIDHCSTCEDHRRKVAPLALFGAAPVLAAPPALRDEVLRRAALHTAHPSVPYEFTATDGFPRLVRAARRVAAWVAPTAAASVLLVAATLSFLWLQRDGGDTIVAGEPSTAVAPTTEAPTTTGDPTTSVAADPAVTTDASTTTAGPTTTGPTTTVTTTTVPVTTTEPPAVAPPPPPPPTAPPATRAPTTPPPAPARLQVSANAIDLGAGSGSGSVTISNVGGQPLSWSLQGDPGVFTVTPGTGTIPPGGSVQLVASIDRSSLGEGNVSASVQVVGAGDSATIRLSAAVERPPAISQASPYFQCIRYVFAAGTLDVLQAEMTAIITDESPPISATFSISGPNGLGGSTAMTGSSSFFGSIAVNPAAPGTWNWTISASDARGNVATTSGSVAVTCS